MSTNLKTEISDDQLDAVFHALADRTRRDLIRRLSRGPAMITELADPFEMTFAAVSKHLRVLEAARLVRREVDGRIHRCTLSLKPMREVDGWIQQYTVFWTDTLTTLANYVEQNPGDRNDE